MPALAGSAKPPAAAGGRGRGGSGGAKGGRGAKGGGKKGGEGGRGSGASGETGGIASQLASLDDRSIEHESSIEILRSQRAAARSGRTVVHDAVRENEGVDEDDPLMTFDDGIRIEPFNMRREMNEGHFDEGGFYIMDKQEEKQVTDAWLDTIDKAQRTATFQQMERQKKAGETATSRLTALSKSLGKEEGDEDEEPDEKEEKDGDAADGNSAAKAEDAAAAEAAEEAEEVPDIIATLESLILELEPLETPLQALARWRRAASSNGSGGADGDAGLPLKMRSRLRQRRNGGNAAAAAAGNGQKRGAGAAGGSGKEAGQKRFALNEWGDYEERERKAMKVVEGASASAATTEAAATDETGNASGDAAAAGGSGVADAAAVAAAAAKAEAEEKARAEAAEAAAADARTSRVVLYADLDAKGNPEFDAIVNLNADDQDKAATAADQGDAGASDGAAGGAGGPAGASADSSATQRKRSAEAGEAELKRRAKISRLTDLCDHLLERGVMVYESTRELLAIEVRERRGEQLSLAPEAEGEADAEGAKAADDAGAPSEAKAAPDASAAGSNGDGGGENADSKPAEVMYVNRRCQPAPDQKASGADEAESDVHPLLRQAQEVGEEKPVAAAGESQLLWQFRWAASPEQVHGPFDSTSMLGWQQQGCFSEERPAEFRQCGADNAPLERCWHGWEKIDFSLYL
eukprot:TRINITY_DN46339_c0_g1_i1.p1 TRINITY_DN46339_c0_g1~~TRINITY_DN46339_c0_g1_i1.p1  ORF type:complete len:693 (-),score=202.12 TRINITY_DN46339_c0_g1_i1:129-2207(-)